MSFGSYDPTKQARKNTYSKKFYLKDGSNLYRVLPPNKSLKDQNKIAQYWSVIWLTDGNGKRRPISSILRTKSQGKGQPKLILQQDPLLVKMEEMKNQLNAAVANGENPAVLAALKQNLKRIQNFKTYALNVISASGELGVLEIPYTAFQALDSRIRDLYTKGIDAIGIGPDKGIFFDFRKQKDERGKTVYSVDPAMKSGKDNSGNFVMSYIRGALTEEEAGLLGEQAEDLTKLYRELSPDEMAALATLDQRVFDAVFQRGAPVEEENDGPVDDETQEDLGSYQQLQTSNFGPGTVAQTQQVAAQQTVVQQQVVNQTPSMSGSVNPGLNGANSAKVKNFLFPDKK